VHVVGELNEKALSIKCRAENVHAILRAFYIEPMLTMNMVSEKAKLPIRTVVNIVNELSDKGLLQETTGFSRNKVYILKDYVDAFRIFD
jgi:DNA-binding MarR family transcriptional regulator